MSVAGTGGPVAVAADEATMGLDLDLQEGGVLGAADGGERTAATPAAAPVARNLPILDHDRQMGMVTTTRPRPAGLLAAPAAWRRGSRGSRRRRHGRGAGLGLCAEELLLAEAQLGT